MSAAAPTLAPLFRSEHQAELLAEIYHGPGPASGHELARRTGIPQQTVARELARLERAGLVSVTQVGAAKLVTPRSDLPYGDALRQLLAWVGGIIPILSAVYGPINEVREVFIFGSWAQRFHGELGPPPNDIDIAVVSDTMTSLDLAAARLEVERRSGAVIDQFVIESDNPRLIELRDGAVTVIARR